MDFKTFYGLSMNPFAKGALPTKDAFQSNDLKALLNRLRYLVNVRGVGVFTASPRMGKSYGIRCFRKELIYYLYKEKRQPLVLILDEAQYLSPGILRDLKMLMNFEYDSLNCFTLILSAEPYFNKTLEKPVNEALRQRIVVHYNFTGLNPDELNAYVIHRIKFAGGSESIIGADALTALNGYCGGNARTVDNVMSIALTLGAQLEHQTIDAEIIMAAINEITLDGSCIYFSMSRVMALRHDLISCPEEFPGIRQGNDKASPCRRSSFAWLQERRFHLDFRRFQSVAGADGKASLHSRYRTAYSSAQNLTYKTFHFLPNTHRRP